MRWSFRKTLYFILEFILIASVTSEASLVSKIKELFYSKKSKFYTTLAQENRSKSAKIEGSYHKRQLAIICTTFWKPEILDKFRYYK